MQHIFRYRSSMPVRSLLGLTVILRAHSVWAADPPGVLRIHTERLRASASPRDFEQLRAEHANSLRGVEFVPPSIAALGGFRQPGTMACGVSPLIRRYGRRYCFT